MKVPKRIKIRGTSYVRADSYAIVPWSKKRLQGIKEALAVVTNTLYEGGWVISKKPAIDTKTGGNLLTVLMTPDGSKIYVSTPIRGHPVSILYSGYQTRRVESIKPDDLIKSLQEFANVLDAVK